MKVVLGTHAYAAELSAKKTKAHLRYVRPENEAHAARVVGADAGLRGRVAPQHVRRQRGRALAVGVDAALARGAQVLLRAQVS